MTSAATLNRAAEREDRATNCQKGFHGDFGNGYAFEDGLGRVPISERDTVLEAVAIREDARNGLVQSPPPAVIAREADLQFVRELFDTLLLDDMRAFHRADATFKRDGQKLHADRLRARAGTKFLLLVWLVEPEFLSSDGNPISLRQLSAMLGVTAACLSPISAELSRRLGISNFFQDHDSQPGRSREGDTALEGAEQLAESGDDEMEGGESNDTAE